MASAIFSSSRPVRLLYNALHFLSTPAWISAKACVPRARRWEVDHGHGLGAIILVGWHFERPEGVGLRSCREHPVAQGLARREGAARHGLGGGESELGCCGAAWLGQTCTAVPATAAEAGNGWTRAVRH